MDRYPIEMTIDDIPVPAAKIGGMTGKPEKIWSKNTSRTASLKMQGTIKGIKWTYSLKWPPLTQAEQELIDSLVSDATKPYHILKMRRPDGSLREMECYFGTPTYTEWAMIGGTWKCTDAAVDAIER
jgi:hypothetical protein